jgi:hypothetical protein
MKRLLILLVVLVGAVAAVGFYRGWFSLSWDRADGKGQVTGTVDEEKIEADKKRALEKVQGLGNNKGNAAKE